MRMRTYWFGVLLIPENVREVDALKQLPKKAEEGYEQGESRWITEHKEFNGSMNPETYVNLPMGKALMIDR